MGYRITPHTNVTNDDGTITISEEGVTETISVNLAKDNTWSATQTVETDGSTVPVVVRAATNQTADLQQWQDASGNVVSRVGPDGQLEISVTSGVISITNDDGTLTITPTTGDAVAKLNLGNANTWSATQTLAPATDTVPLVIKASATQTAALQQWQDTTGKTLSSVNAAGQFVLATSTGTPSGSATDGTCVVDPSNLKLWIYLQGDWRESTLFGEPSLCQGRLTLTSGTPVTTQDVIGASTIYFTPFGGKRISLYDGKGWVSHQFTEASLALGGLTLGIPYDVYGYWNNGLVLGLDPWSGPNARTGNLNLQDGIYVMAVDPTYRFLATIYPTSATTTEDSDAKRFVNNYYNYRLRRLRIADTGTHTYNTTVWRPYNNNAVNRVEFVISMVEDAIHCALFAQVNANGAAGINVDATDGSGVLQQCIANANNSSVWAGSSPTFLPPSEGYHFLQAMEYSGGGQTSNFTGMVLNGMIPG
jgi:hypothetical protein